MMLLAVDAGALADSVNAVWILTISFLIFFMQPGFLLLEAGQIRSKNVANVAMKNMFDWSVGVLVFFLVGLGLANLVGGLTSSGAVSLAESFSYVNAPGEWIGWLSGAVFAMTAATIVSGAVVGRIKFRSYVVYSATLTMLIYPVVIGLTWQGGLLSADGYLGVALGAGYLDFAGGTIVHMVGGLAGLTAAAVVGPRNDRYDEDGSSNPIPGHSVLFAVLGTLFLAFGWYGFNVGTQATVLTEGGNFLGPALGRVAIVTTLGMGAGALAASLVTTYYQGKPDPLFTANGLLAGLVAITGGAAYVTWWGGLALGALGGALVYPVYRWTTDSLRIDDVCGVFAVHGAAGGVGTILVPFVGVGSAGSWAFLGVEQLLVQVAGVAVIGTWTVLATMAVFLVLGATLGLRWDDDSQLQGLDQIEHNIVAYPQFVTDGGVDTGESSSQGHQEASDPTMWRGEEVGGETGRSVLDGAGIDRFPDPVLIVDADNEITALNPRAIQFFRVLEDEALGSTPQSLPASSEAGLTATRDALDRGEEIRDRTGTVTIDGEDIPVRVTATPLRDDGNLVGVMAVVSNNAAAVASEQRHKTVEEYYESGLEAHREQLAGLADGDLDVEARVPDPPAETPQLTAMSETFTDLNGLVVETADNVRAIVEKLPGQSEELAESSETLSESSTEVRDAASHIDDITTEIEAELATLADRTEQANGNVSELSAAIEEVSASAAEIETQSSEAEQMARDGVTEMQDAVTQIRSATEHSAAVASEIDSLEAQMESVAEIVDIIQDIATQTNMLALNASIEAANASGDGDGFAVVADEVKSLAEQTKQSAEEIDEIIADAQTQTTDVAETIRETNEEVTTGAGAVEEAVTTLEQIRGRVAETSTGVAEISTAVERQAENTESVSATMQDVTEMTEGIDDLAGDISASADRQAGELDDVTGLADRLHAIAREVHGNIDQFDLAAELRTQAR